MLSVLSCVSQNTRLESCLFPLRISLLRRCFFKAFAASLSSELSLPLTPGYCVTLVGRAYFWALFALICHLYVMLQPTWYSTSHHPSRPWPRRRHPQHSTPLRRRCKYPRSSWPADELSYEITDPKGIWSGLLQRRTRRAPQIGAFWILWSCLFYGRSHSKGTRIRIRNGTRTRVTCHAAAYHMRSKLCLLTLDNWSVTGRTAMMIVMMRTARTHWWVFDRCDLHPRWG
mgnify:CR=1 FL=1